MSGGKPAGFKLAIGHPVGMVRHRQAMHQTGITCRISSSSTAPRAAPARRRRSSSTTSACRCTRACCWCTTPWSGWACASASRAHRRGRADRQRLRHGAHVRAGRGLVQRRARLHVRARLHPGAELPHRLLPDRRGYPGPRPLEEAGRAGQGHAVATSTTTRSRRCATAVRGRLTHPEQRSVLNTSCAACRRPKSVPCASCIPRWRRANCSTPCRGIRCSATTGPSRAATASPRRPRSIRCGNRNRIERRGRAEFAVPRASGYTAAVSGRLAQR